MATLQVLLFDRLSIHYDGRALGGIDAAKAQELLCYLLLFRDRAHSRESLASLLWGDCPTSQARKYLRQTLWQLQAALSPHLPMVERRMLRVEPDWVRVDASEGLWLDVAVLEQAFARAHGTPGRELDAGRAHALREAVQLYRGNLLDGWYQDWCLEERQRLQAMVLMMLDKLMEYYAVRKEYEASLAYGERILRYERAHERTHRWLMRLYYLSGDRTAALRQYGYCAATLDEELGVKPAKRTVELYEQLRADRLDDAPWFAQEGAVTAGTPQPRYSELLDRLNDIQSLLVSLQRRMTRDITVAPISLGERRSRSTTAPATAWTRGEETETC